MSETVRFTLRLPPPVHGVIEDAAGRLGLTNAAVIRRALGIMQAVDDARREGLHVGATHDRAALKVLIVPTL